MPQYDRFLLLQMSICLRSNFGSAGLFSLWLRAYGQCVGIPGEGAR